MLGRVEMFGRVLILGRIATSYMATSQTKSEVNPGVASPQTLFTSPFVRTRNLNLIKMGTSFGHVPSFPDPGGE
jgi:hypothetical protein